MHTAFGKSPRNFQLALESRQALAQICTSARDLNCGRTGLPANRAPGGTRLLAPVHGHASFQEDRDQRCQPYDQSPCVQAWVPRWRPIRGFASP